MIDNLLQPGARGWVYDLFSGDYDRQVNASTSFYDAIQVDIWGREIIVDLGLLPRFVQLLREDPPGLQVQSQSSHGFLFSFTLSVSSL